jgi:hypothetical protein
MDQMKKQLSDVMHLDIVARMGIKGVKAGAYQNHGLRMVEKIVMMVQMKKNRKTQNGVSEI